MISSLVGMTVSRTIPDATLAGLAMGRYALHGGVVRWAAGTPQAGQIVAHLLPAAAVAAPLITGAGIVTGVASVVGGIGALVGAGFGIASFFQSRKILKVARETMQLAELNLSVTQAGFAALDHRLAHLELILRDVKGSLTSIQRLLESSQRAELLVALEHLEKLPSIRDERVCIELLTHSATVLGKLRRVYLEQLRGLTAIPEALAIEEYYLVASLGQVCCYAELRELTMARAILSDVVKEWRDWAGLFSRVVLLGEQPQRFLYADFAPHAPLPLVAAWCDFAFNKREGLLWIEALRQKQDPWYYQRSLDGEPRELRRVDNASGREAKLAFEQGRVIPALNKLLARYAVLASYEAQYELLEQQNMTPGELESQVQALALPEQSQDEESEAFIVLSAGEPVSS